MAGRKNLSQRAQVVELNKHLTAREIGARLGISRQRVYQILSEETDDYLALNRKHIRDRKMSRNLARSLAPEVAWVNRQTRGAISELLVAIDLLAIGWKPYIPLFRNHGHDIIALKDGEIITIEVRSGRRLKDGTIQTNKEKAAHPADHFAFVLPDEPVVYEPPLFREPPDLAQIERETALREKILIGIAAAKAEKRGGKRGGGRSHYTDEQIREAKAKRQSGALWRDAAASIGMSESALMKRIKRLSCNGGQDA